jgi:hypothetical protein
MAASQRQGVAPGAPWRRAAVHAAPRPKAARRSGSTALTHLDLTAKVAADDVGLVGIALTHLDLTAKVAGDDLAAGVDAYGKLPLDQQIRMAGNAVMVGLKDTADPATGTGDKVSQGWRLDGLLAWRTLPTDTADTLTLAYDTLKRPTKITLNRTGFRGDSADWVSGAWGSETTIRSRGRPAVLVDEPQPGGPAVGRRAGRRGSAPRPLRGARQGRE